MQDIFLFPYNKSGIVSLVNTFIDMTFHGGAGGGAQKLVTSVLRRSFNGRVLYEKILLQQGGLDVKWCYHFHNLNYICVYDIATCDIK